MLVVGGLFPASSTGFEPRLDNKRVLAWFLCCTLAFQPITSLINVTRQFQRTHHYHAGLFTLSAPGCNVQAHASSPDLMQGLVQFPVSRIVENAYGSFQAMSLGVHRSASARTSLRKDTSSISFCVY
ncbi:hypothetical protein DAEQUDRAFT_449705 [Daedalea quercina L-15889]|uniref:Uncharacterized protein n=1 Tax=Daedalea quercina L-15889 TaxID=1314783 RepID=A0A165N6L0_9APHY|nr:hypothetical protein DAEQUDRAFT_449705 [Daedalea quercina L-15889]